MTHEKDIGTFQITYVNTGIYSVINTNSLSEFCIG